MSQSKTDMYGGGGHHITKTSHFWQIAPYPLGVLYHETDEIKYDYYMNLLAAFL